MPIMDGGWTQWLPIVMIALLILLVAMWFLYERLNSHKNLASLSNMRKWKYMQLPGSKGQRYPSYQIKGWVEDHEWIFESRWGDKAGWTAWKMQLPGSAFLFQPSAGGDVSDMTAIPLPEGLEGYEAFAQQSETARQWIQALQDALIEWNAKHGSDRDLTIRATRSGLEVRLPYYEKGLRDVQWLIRIGVTLAKAIGTESENEVL